MVAHARLTQQLLCASHQDEIGFTLGVNGQPGASQSGEASVSVVKVLKCRYPTRCHGNMLKFQRVHVFNLHTVIHNSKVGFPLVLVVSILDLFSLSHPP